MKIFKILEPASRKVVEDYLKENGSGISLPVDYVHPQEDFLFVPNGKPIFAVADGVTLVPEDISKYPDPSGAGEVAKIFCVESVQKAEDIYPDFAEKDILNVFGAANKKIGEYNAKEGRTPETIDFGEFDYFHTTAAFGLIKETKLFWGVVCDSEVSLFDKNGTQKFMSPPCWQFGKEDNHPDWNRMSLKEKIIFNHKRARNRLDKKGDPVGYGVLTGEPEAMKYVCYGILKIEPEDIFFLFTDGFADYLKLPEFVDFFMDWSPNLEYKVKNFTVQKSQENPEKYGHERSLIAVKFEN